MGMTCEAAAEKEEARKCRFCANLIEGASLSMVPAFKDVCREAECIELMNRSCDKMHECGHHCCGFKGEENCLPCLQEDCIEKFNETAAEGDKILDSCTVDDYCEICYTSGLGDEPSVAIGCKHMFHVECLYKILRQKWNGPRITFAFLECPKCKKQISAPHCKTLNDEITSTLELKAIVESKALVRAEHEGL